MWPPDLTAGGYRSIVADPPWPYDVVDRTKAEAARRYRLMSIEQLEQLPVAELADPSGCVLWCWATNRHLADGRAARVVQSWGFRPVTLVTWRKTGQPGVGWWARSNTEHVIVATIGSPQLPDPPLPATCFDWPRPSGGRSTSASWSHSRKPPALADLIEAHTPGPYVELFARQGRFGWDSWGLGHEVDVARERCAREVIA